MKLYTLFIITALMIFWSCENSTSKNIKEQTTEKKANKVAAPAKLLRHVVLFNFNESATIDTIEKIEKEFAGLEKNIPAIHSFEWGINNSPEGLDKGLTHCFLVTFLSEEDRAVYLPHPAHQEFVKFIGPYVEDVTVLDYWQQ